MPLIPFMKAKELLGCSGLDLNGHVTAERLKEHPGRMFEEDAVLAFKAELAAERETASSADTGDVPAASSPPALALEPAAHVATPEEVAAAHAARDAALRERGKTLTKKRPTVDPEAHRERTRKERANRPGWFASLLGRTLK